MLVTKVAVVHLLPAPYRLRLFERMLKDESLDVRFFLTDRQAPNRPTWNPSTLPSDPRVTRLPEISIPILHSRGDILRVNVGLSRVFDWKPDVVFVCGHNELTSILVALMCIAKRVPYAFFAEVSNSRDWSALRKASLIFMSLLVRRATVLVPSSESCRSFYSQLGGSDGRMVLLPCVPDVRMLIEKSNELADSRDALRNEAGLQNRFVVLFVGRLVDYKGVRELMTALAEVRVRDPKVVLLIIGYGPLEGYLREECAKMPDNARYVGFVDDKKLLELYSVADLHVMPSWAEPYGVVCAEALALGIPSIVTDTSGCVDLVRNGFNGYVIRPRSPEAIAESILKLSMDSVLYASMKANSRSIVEEFDMDFLYRHLKEVIAKALDERGGPGLSDG